MAKVLLSYLSDIFNIMLGSDCESMARWWVSNTKHKIMNGFSAALMWSLWKFRNEMCFQGRIWTGEKTLIRRMLNTLKNWRSLYPEEDATKLDQVLSRLAAKLEAPLQLMPPHGGSTTTPTVPRSSSQEVNSSDSEASHGRVPPCAMPLETTEGPTFPASTCLDNDIVIGRLDAL